MKSPKSPSSEVISGLVTIPDAAVAAFLRTMQKSLLNEARTEGGVALTEHLERKKLDFSIDSLHEIDRYLNCVHDNAHSVSGLPLLSTIWTIAMYIGEVIRRESPSKRFQWVSVGESSGSSGETTIANPDLDTMRALRARDGDMCMPSRAVLRVILRGAKARSIHSFARGAMGLTESSTKLSTSPDRAP